MSDSARHGPPRVDEANQCIWWGEQRIELTPKAFLVLRCLMQRQHQLVSKSELLAAAWPDLHVMEGVLKVAINQLRDAFRDDPQQPRFIETVHRRGYRWIGATEAPAARRNPPLDPALTPSPLLDATPFLFVGRQAALAQLEQAIARAAGGTRQMVFVTGDPGIGKTELIDHFIKRLPGEERRLGGSRFAVKGEEDNLARNRLTANRLF